MESTSGGAAVLRRQSYREACPVDRQRDSPREPARDSSASSLCESGDSGFQDAAADKAEVVSETEVVDSGGLEEEQTTTTSSGSSASSTESESSFLGFLRNILTANVPSDEQLPVSEEPSGEPEAPTRSTSLTLLRNMSARRLDSTSIPVDLAPIPENEVLAPSTPLPETPTHRAPTLSGSEAPAESDEEREVRVGGYWPHSPSSLLATFTCTVGLCDICRFSYLSYQYGGGFILQFLMLTVIFGLPMLSFQMSLGQFMGSGAMDMWKASPIFFGVGISAVIAMATIGIYDVIPISYMFVYFRDSFATGLTFKWGECRNAYSIDDCDRVGPNNYSEVFRTAVPAYFQNRVLQRLPNAARAGVGVTSSADLVFENVFNLAVIWMIVFICLSKGIKSYGKVVVVFGIFPLLTFYLLSIELLRRASSGAEYIISLNTDMSKFFFNGWSWLAAAREVFFIWGLNGFAIMQIASHNKFHHNLKRDCAIIITLTLSILLLSAFLACACIFIIYKTQGYNYTYMPSSYESLSTSRFLVPTVDFHRQQSPVLQRVDVSDYMTVNYLLGAESITANSDTNTYSGYQVIRLATELYPMAVVVLGPKIVSAFWPVLFYLCLITFGLARQLAIWRCVVEGLTAIYPEKLRPWETSITFLSCVFGFILGLPFATQIGAVVVHFMDVCVGCVWWIMVIYLAQVFGLLLVRGHPFSSDDVVNVLTTIPNMKKWLAPVISFSWNAVLPVTYLVLSITSFKLGNFGRMFSWLDSDSYDYWPVWSKQLGALLQLTPVLLIPIVALIQLLRYSIGQPNGGEFSERLQRLVRPTVAGPPSGARRSQEAAETSGNGQAEAGATGTEEAQRDDPPPKYTPPPSYNTATGLKLLKRLNSFRMSFRRSMRNSSSVQRADSQQRSAEDDVEMQATQPQTPQTNENSSNLTN